MLPWVYYKVSIERPIADAMGMPERILMEDTQVDIIKAVIGINDHPSITFHFDTNNFHSPDTVWFLESVTFDGCDRSCPRSFYQNIIEFCNNELLKA